MYRVVRLISYIMEIYEKNIETMVHCAAVTGNNNTYQKSQNAGV